LAAEADNERLETTATRPVLGMVAPWRCAIGCRGRQRAAGDGGATVLGMDLHRGGAQPCPVVVHSADAGLPLPPRPRNAVTSRSPVRTAAR